MWNSLFTAGESGSEGGVILRDEEYRNTCRITLERCIDRYAVTCGIYGAFCHTAYCGESDHLQMYQNMKRDLQIFLDQDTTADETLSFYESFAAKY